jgi:hypothetical protein
MPRRVAIDSLGSPCQGESFGEGRQRDEDEGRKRCHSEGLVRDSGWGQAVGVIGDAIKGIHEAACTSGVPSDQQ